MTGIISTAGYDETLAALSGSGRWAVRALREARAAGKKPHAYVGTQKVTARWKGVIWISEKVADQLVEGGFIEVDENRVVTLIEEQDG